jgi:hypothetical protein
MARAKTSPFVLSETVRLTATDTAGTAQIDLGSYVDVSSKTGLAVRSIDVIFQIYDTTNNKVVQNENLYTGGFAYWATLQLFDQNRNDLQIANDNSLVGSGTQQYDGAYLTSYENDVYPDSYPSPGRITISPQLTAVGKALSEPAAVFAANHALYMTVRVTAELVKLNEKDWMAIAIQGQALNA